MSYCKRSKTWVPITQMVKALNAEDEYEVVNIELVDTWICHECNKRFITEDVPYNEAYDNGDYVYICDECADAYYNRCDDCGYLYNQDDMYWIEGSQRDVCEDCYNESYGRCEHCGEYFSLDDLQSTDTGNYLCGDCAGDYNVCDCCNRIIYSDEYYYDDDDEYEEYPICRRCAEERGIIDKQKIRNYGYKPMPLFHKIVNEKRTDEYFGFEIEVEGNRKYANGFLEVFGDTEEQDLYLKKDGSVSGFEIVTHPMTRRYFYKKFMPKLTKSMNYLKASGFRGHNRAGIHIHVSNKAISQDQFKKLMLLLYPEQDSIYKKWLAITQRHDNNMRRWSSMKIGCDKQNARKIKKKAANLVEENKRTGYIYKPSLAGCRYTAMNTENSSTIEFRMFNSNIRPERIIKNAQVIFSLLDFTLTDKLPTFGNYMRFIEDNKETYRELWDFLLEKNIYQPREKRENLKKLLKTAKEIDASVNNYNEMMTMLRTLEPKQVTGIDDNDERIEGDETCVLPF